MFEKLRVGYNVPLRVGKASSGLCIAHSVDRETGFESFHVTRKRLVDKAAVFIERKIYRAIRDVIDDQTNPRIVYGTVVFPTPARDEVIASAKGKRRIAAL